MGLSLFDLEQEFINIQQAFEENGGELTEELEAAMKINEIDLTNKAIGYAKVMMTMEMEIDMIKAEQERLEKQKVTRSNTYDRLKFAITEAMKLYGKDKIVTPTLTLSLRKSTVVDVYDEDSIPLSYFENKPVVSQLNKKALKTDLTLGMEVPGAELKENKNLNIK